MSSDQPITRQRADKVMPLFVGYVLMLGQFVLMAIGIMGVAFEWFSTGALVGVWIGWAVLLVLSLWAMAHQVTVNRYNEAQGSHPSPHLLVPTETQARVEAYKRNYQSREAAAPATEVGDLERVAA